MSDIRARLAKIEKTEERLHPLPRRIFVYYPGEEYPAAAAPQDVVLQVVYQDDKPKTNKHRNEGI